MPNTRNSFVHKRRCIILAPLNKMPFAAPVASVSYPTECVLYIVWVLFNPDILRISNNSITIAVRARYPPRHGASSFG
jgi:hypothetical protein